MVKEGYPFFLPPLALAIGFGLFAGWNDSTTAVLLTVVFALLAAFMAYFFRDPERNIPKGDDIVISCADGKVTRVEETPEGRLVSIFLSPLDVHVNRAPIGGRVVKVEYIKGKKNPATSNEASFVNERNSITIEGARMTVKCTQIAGIVARRIVCWSTEGTSLELGERFGLIKFSSRTDLLMPKDVEVLVTVGDRVVGGETVIARLRP
jgi:phosphatidylserine decarboxylase